MDSHRKLIMLVILSLLMKVALSQNGVVMGKNIFKWSFFPKIYVYIRNDIGGGLMLHASCYNNIHGYARDRTFLPGRRTEFAQFTKSFWGRTYYDCLFRFGARKRRFTVYRDSRDNIDKYQCRNCFWSIRRNGPCALNSHTGRYDICYPWDK
ncbi:Plant self-incompatibility S1 [Arabidopsis suecica]|uniref:Plant self-incompatibility S1 n=1 Tax=Arabidopsis suecica TaxID=45249 RepID=A0A8T2A1K9_ARASU|nr:Plant self-incompatibility S1 [Arabidopsis suecica]